VHTSAQSQFLLPKKLGLPNTSLWPILLQSRNMGELNNKHIISRSVPAADGQGPLQTTYAELLLRLSFRRVQAVQLRGLPRKWEQILYCRGLQGDLCQSSSSNENLHDECRRSSDRDRPLLDASRSRTLPSSEAFLVV